MITRDVWKAISNKRYEDWLPVLDEIPASYGIDTPQRLAMFLAQASHESAGFSRLTENLNYSAERLAAVWPKRYKNQDGKPNALAIRIARNPELIANATYSGRMGNGPCTSGDGWKFRGRGIFQLTGRYNYESFFSDTGFQIEPEDLATPMFASISASWYWQKNKLNAFADIGDIRGCTLAINGGIHGLAERTKLYEKIRKLL